MISFTPAMLNAIPDNLPVPPDRATGLIPRDYRRHPVGCLAYAPAFPDSMLLEPAQIKTRLEENRANNSGLLDIRQNDYDILKSLDQDGLGLCWAFSTTKAVMYLRALMGESPVRLSAWYVAGIINGWRDRGGWGAASLKFVRETGVPAESYCPSYKSSYDNQATRDNAALHKVTEWWDGSDDPNMAQQQLLSCLVQCIPCVVDLNDMGHSMCAIDIASLNPVKIIYDNSWGEGDNHGLYIGSGARARPDGLVIPRVTMPTPT